jgi:hypothetical protein
LRGVSKGWLHALVAHPSRLAEDGEHLRMTAVHMAGSKLMPAYDGTRIARPEIR